MKRAPYIHEDVIFTTIHRMRDPEERGLDALHKELVAETVDEYSAYLLEHAA